MLFSSIEFILYFLPAVLFVYYLFIWCLPVKNLILLASSLLFYAWGEPVSIFLMLFSILANYILAIVIEAKKKQGKRQLAKTYMVADVLLNLTLLFVFKYADFLIMEVNQAYQISIPQLFLSLPLGISFFTFQALSYVVDVYKGQVTANKSLFAVALYISFFPQLVAGPIVRYDLMNAQIKRRRESLEAMIAGGLRFNLGLAKKVLISNQMAIMADRIFQLNQMGELSVSLAWLGAIAFSLQIYFDFSGYSDMAVGLGSLFGFTLPENFDYPYASLSVSEFWRRWHISLGSWFKDYVYVPLGGSRTKNSDLTIRNLAVVWVLTGIWHGSEWTFLIWGLFNLSLIILERFFFFEQWKNRKLRAVLMFITINISWVIFRAENLYYAGTYLRSMLLMGTNGFCSYTVMFLKEYWIYLCFGVLFSLPIIPRLKNWQKQASGWVTVTFIAYPFVAVCLFLLSIIYLNRGSYNPFIYFNF